MALLPALLALMAGCAAPGPAPAARLGLKLAPAALGEQVSVQQHLTVERDGRIDELDAALEIDAANLQLVGIAFGQRVLSISYDGNQLKTWRHVMLPAQVRGEDVLDDMQLALWPAAAIAAGLPAGWRIADAGLQRRLYLKDRLVVSIDYSAMPRWSGTIRMNNLHYGYRLTIQSAQ
jgi:hypothetical protein